MDAHDTRSEGMKDFPESIVKEPHTELPLVARSCDNKEVDKNSPGSAANTVNPGPNHREGVANLILPKLPAWVTDQATAIHYLEYAHHGYKNARETRTHAAFTARHHGITNRAIGEIFGIAESTVRLMLKKAGER